MSYTFRQGPGADTMGNRARCATSSQRLMSAPNSKVRMPTTRKRSLQETLEAEYPLLDTSLLAAFISDLRDDSNDSSLSTDNALGALRQTLSQLSVLAEVQLEQIETDPAVHNHRKDDGIDSSLPQDIEDVRGSENDPSSLDDLSQSGFGINTSTSSATSATPTMSPSDFLRILFPQIPDDVIQNALLEHHILENEQIQPLESISDEPDLSTVVDDLLSFEYIQDLVERGFEPAPDAENDLNLWEQVKAKRKNVRPKPSRRSRPHPIPIVDIRQRHHVSHERPAASPSRASFSGDPWTRLTSLATRLSQLLPPTPPSFFMSYFHAPNLSDHITRAGWKTEGDGLRSALLSLTGKQRALSEDELKNSFRAVREIVLNPDSNQFLSLNAGQKARVEADIQLCVAATRGESSTALDLVWLLRELDVAFEQGDGIAHSLLFPVNTKILSPMPENSTRPQNPVRAEQSAPPPNAAKSHQIILPVDSQPIPPPPLYGNIPSSSKEDEGWKLVGRRRRKDGHAHVMPIANTGQPIQGSGSGEDEGIGKPHHSAVWYRERALEQQSQRCEALRTAMRHWQNSNARTHGGGAAFFYAEKARELWAREKEWSLKAARAMVHEKQLASHEHNTLDLHGLTVEEACVIVGDAIEAAPPSPSRPLKIITGRGRHSVGQVSVLGPAVRDMVFDKGYRVDKWDGGLVVRGRR